MAENINRVVVIGGGYAGVLAANRLQRPGLNVTLINPRPRFVERIRLHQLVAGNHAATAAYADVLGPDVRLVVDTAERIDAPGRRVLLASGGEGGYDYLIYAVGSTGALPEGASGAAEFAYPLAELEQAERLRDRLAELSPDAPAVVVGGGLTGIEAAAEFAGAGRPVTLVGAQLGPSLAASGRRSVAKRLAGLGVTVVSGQVTAVSADAVTLADGRALPSAVTVWTAGFTVPGLAAASGLRTDELGRLCTDETLTSVDDPRIVAAGDAAAPSGLPMRMSCQAATPMGAQAAQTVLARIAGTEPAPLSQAFTGQCISLGRDAGMVQLAHTDDRPRSAYLGGRAAALVKEQVCRATVSFLAREASKPGSYRWLRSGWRRERLASESAAQPVAAR
ncbi:MAG TPA: FAD-dependent oxidoreductase [Mycobacterium sp.]|nr:FAD-dependent oxidoreductase [Mycobacterium sp.]